MVEVGVASKVQLVHRCGDVLERREKKDDKVMTKSMPQQLAMLVDTR